MGYSRGPLNATKSPLLIGDAKSEEVVQKISINKK